MMMVAGEKLPTDSNVKAPAGAVRCPRCDSGNTKFCYYNNYSLSQPRHFCRACKRYWTRGGALRNVPVGGRCHRRKNKRTAAAATKKSPFLPLPSSPSSRLPPLRHQDPNNSSVFAGPHTLDAPSLPFIDAGGGFNLPPLPPSAANLGDGACLPPPSLLFCGMKEDYHDAVFPFDEMPSRDMNIVFAKELTAEAQSNNDVNNDWQMISPQENLATIFCDTAALAGGWPESC
ncbi:hypothetical protein ZIOFF_016855 [Zingiber officinale]|uniref:Dof zinc finger protein n=1 Tax=Zingiber officinale TaxID=94328 RepID=A0A8J5I332_ZINOF|nr:hypothetical protein ZIOFF_016855 [Zingiber officinale]